MLCGVLGQDEWAGAVKSFDTMHGPSLLEIQE
jgi:hypothetical protein